MATGGEDDERDMEDPLLRLPREIFISILSLLPTEEVVRMACLSKAWRDLDITNLILPSLPILMFDCYHCNDGCRESMAKAIECSLKLGPKQVISLEKLRIRFDTWMESPSLSIDSWIGAAFERKVTELDLCFEGAMFYDFPAELFSTANSSLAVLRLDRFRLEPKVLTAAAATTITVLSLSHCCLSGMWGDINFPALRSLSLLSTYIDGVDESVQKLISGCPSLETLSIKQEIMGDHPTGNFKIFGLPRLRRLDMFDCSNMGGMEIDASSLEYLSCDRLGVSEPFEIVFSHCESLKELRLIGLRISGDYIQNLGSTLPNLEKLDLTCCYTNRIEISHPNLKEFEVRFTGFHMEDIKIDAPNLHSFIYQGFSLALVPVMSSMHTSSLQEVWIDVVDYC